VKIIAQSRRLCSNYKQNKHFTIYLKKCFHPHPSYQKPYIHKISGCYVWTVFDTSYHLSSGNSTRFPWHSINGTSFSTYSYAVFGIESTFSFSLFYIVINISGYNKFPERLLRNHFPIFSSL
jgi:hypothetical protein